MKISVVGGGYVGLITGACLAEKGHHVTIIDIDKEKIDAINSARPPIYEKGLEELLARHSGKNLSASTGYESVRDSEISIICVGTPMGEDGSADLKYIVSAAESIGRELKNSGVYHVVTVKSTVPPGTTSGVVIPAVRSASGNNPNIGFAMNPEFLREGIAVDDFMNPDRVVIGSDDKKSGDLVESLYSGFNAKILRTGLISAEMIKYASNSFLATKISFSNEVGNICKSLGIDVYEVMEGVGLDHRISPYFLNAGCGFGGSCFPKDVSALIHLAKSKGVDPVLLRSVLKVNEVQPLLIIDILKKHLGNLNGKRIAVLGLAFKGDTDDIRDSRAVPAIERLIAEKADVHAFDPMANENMKAVFPEITYHDSAAGALEDADGCLVMTEWPKFSRLDKEFDKMKQRVIIEGRRILSVPDAEGICW
ncbi:UDP-glucose dehydrogenase family protein [Methanolacinia paynteri]|uniref:UDP-glucose dehydrogenase family protein n=1 Tax=Methanolacinia paynteri TaxID=230356 RepID=UPI00064E3C62|nr:UDP-glucose/GDP-mannose dehydrogenase family protein [Methanolacinia paynteri]